MAFVALIDKVIVENVSDNEDSSDDEVPKKMTLCRKELNEVKTKKADLLVKQDKTTRLVETLVMENTSLEEKGQKSWNWA